MGCFAGIRPAKRRTNQNEWDKEFQMVRKGMSAALVAACVMGASSMAQAHQTGSIGAEKSDFDLSGLFQGSLYEAVFGGPKGPTPPPKFDGSDPVTNPPGPRPPPK